MLTSVEASDIVTVEGAGHGLHFEKPQQVRRILHAFLLASEEDNVHRIAKAQTREDERDEKIRTFL